MPSDSADRVMSLLAAGVPLSLLVDLADPGGIDSLEPEFIIDVTAEPAVRLSRAEPA